VLKLVNSTRPDLPCIVISGTIAEEAAVTAAVEGGAARPRLA